MIYCRNFLSIDSQLSPTRILIWPADIEVEVGALVPIMCTGTGWPLPFITVNRGESLMKHPRFSFIIIPEDAFTVSVMMNMTDAEVGDTGEYSCKGTSSEGHDQQFFFVGVLGTNVQIIG